MASGLALGRISVRPRCPRRVVTLLAIVLLAGQFTAASSQSQTAVSTCPDLRICPVRVDSLRRLFNSSDIESFEECYTSFNSASQRYLQASTLVDATINSFLVAVERLTQSACSSSVLNRNGSRINASRITDSTCSELGTALTHINRSREIFSRWASNCTSESWSSVVLDSAQYSQAENVEAHLSMCFRLLSALVNETKAAAMASCSCVQNITLSSDHACVHAANQSICSSGLLPLDLLSERFTSQACASSFFALANGTFNRLEFVEGRLRASFSVDETANSNDTTLTVSQQVKVVLCQSAFPYEDQPFQNETSDNDSPSLRLCENTCHRLRNTLNAMTDVLDSGKSPLIAFLREQTERVCSAMTQSSSDCIDLSRYLTLFLRPSSSPREQFCLNFTCHFPLRRTFNPNHWVASTQTHLQALFNLSRAVFPTATLPFNGSLLPCGLACTSVTYTKEEEKAARIVRSVLGFISTSTNLVAIVAYFLNRNKLRHAARRLNVYLNIVFVFGQGSEMILAGFPSISTPITCYPDETLRMNEPNSTEGLTLCVFFAFKDLLCSYILFFVGVSMAHEWYLMLSTLGNLRLWETFEKNERRREIAYGIFSATLSVVLAVVSVARQVYTGTPERGSCTADTDDSFYVVSIAFFVVNAITVIYFVLGMPKLYQIYKGVKLYPQRTASLFRRSNATLPPRSSMHIKGVKSLLKVLSAYALVITCSFFAIPLIYSYSFAISRDTTAATQRHINCRMSQCRTDLCPSLPKLSIFHTIVPEAYIAFIGVVLSAWAFSWSSYWKEHWIVFAMKMRQYCGIRAVWIPANPSPSNDIALRVQAPTPPLNGILRQTLSSREAGQDDSISRVQE